MLDIRFIRENAQLVAEKSKQKGYEVDIKKLLKLDEKRRGLMSEIEELRAERNELAQNLSPSLSVSSSPSPEDMDTGREIRDKLATLEVDLKPIDEEFWKLLKSVPNMPSDNVPVGTSEKDNVAGELKGNKPKFDFEPKTHWEIGESRDFIDKFRAANITGSRFVYLKGSLVQLQFAIVQFVLASLTNEQILKEIIKKAQLKIPSKPFLPVLPPAMIREEVFEAMDRLEPREDRYQVGPPEDKLWLQGSAEHTLGPMHMDDFLSEEEFPKRYIGYLTSFRREAGTYGKETEGIIRMHQFDKLEMESFTLSEHGLDEHKFMVAVQEYLMQQLELPYRVLKKCTADIGKPNASGIDLEVWMPGSNRFLETHTADFMTDYQARRLGIRVKRANGEIELVHTNDATAFAMGRTLAAIIENFQTKDGNVAIPKVLQPYMHGQKNL